MGLQSIKKNYIKLLEAFSEAGVTLTESQKETMDNFVTDIQETLENQKKEVEDKLSNEYKAAFESILKHQKEHAELTGKIQEKITAEKEAKQISEAVDSFLGEYVEQILPEKTLVDYAKMQKLEQIQESLKEMLVVSEANICDKTAEIAKNMTEKTEEVSKKLDECEEKLAIQEKELSSLKAEKFVNEKTKDLPEMESEMVKAKTKDMGLEEVTEKYESILESVKTEIAEEKVIKEDDTKTLDEAITEILEKKNASAEICDKETQETESNPEEAIDEDLDTVQITESQMQAWIDTLNRITPKN
jgi:hypothetical protein